MRFEVDKCRKLHNARVRVQNKLDKKPINKGTITQQAIGHQLYPENKDYFQVAGMIRKLVKNDNKYIKIEWVKIICDTFNVDGNFAFGFPSSFDEEYNKYFPTNK